MWTVWNEPTVPYSTQTVKGKPSESVLQLLVYYEGELHTLIQNDSKHFPILRPSISCDAWRLSVGTQALFQKALRDCLPEPIWIRQLPRRARLLLDFSSYDSQVETQCW